MKWKTISKIIAYILVALLLVLIIGLAYKFLKNDDGKVTGVELDTTEIIFTDTTGNVSSEYTVEYLITGDATNLADITVDGTKKAAKGETATFTVTVNDTDYYISEMRTSVMNSTETPEIQEADGVYTFTMPQGNVYVRIYFSYTPEVAETEKYRIEYDTLGSGSVLSVDVDCPSYAVAGETVTFTLTLVDLSDVFEDYKPLSITNIVLQYQDTGEDFYGFSQSGEGSYTFVMPEADVTIMIYLMYE